MAGEPKPQAETHQPGPTRAALDALEGLNENNDVGVINKFEAFIRTVEMQSGDIILTNDANALITAALEIIELLQ